MGVWLTQWALGSEESTRQAGSPGWNGASRDQGSQETSCSPLPLGVEGNRGADESV
jgi:hypothetical protein